MISSNTSHKIDSAIHHEILTDDKIDREFEKYTQQVSLFSQCSRNSKIICANKDVANQIQQDPVLQDIRRNRPTSLVLARDSFMETQTSKTTPNSPDFKRSSCKDRKASKEKLKIKRSSSRLQNITKCNSYDKVIKDIVHTPRSHVSPTETKNYCNEFFPSADSQSDEDDIKIVHAGAIPSNIITKKNKIKKSLSFRSKTQVRKDNNSYTLPANQVNQYKDELEEEIPDCQTQVQLTRFKQLPENSNQRRQIEDPNLLQIIARSTSIHCERERPARIKESRYSVGYNSLDVKTYNNINRNFYKDKYDSEIENTMTHHFPKQEINSYRRRPCILKTSRRSSNIALGINPKSSSLNDLTSIPDSVCTTDIMPEDEETGMVYNTATLPNRGNSIQYKSKYDAIQNTPMTSGRANPCMRKKGLSDRANVISLHSTCTRQSDTTMPKLFSVDDSVNLTNIPAENIRNLSGDTNTAISDDSQYVHSMAAEQRVDRAETPLR